MKQFTHYNADGALVLDFTGDRRWLVEPMGDELRLTPVHATAAAGSPPTGEEAAVARPIVLKFDKPGSLSAVAVGADRVRKNIEDAAKVKAEYEQDMAQFNALKAQVEQMAVNLQNKYGK